MQEETIQNLLNQFSPGRLLLAIVCFATTWLFVHLLRLGAERLQQKFGRHRLFIASVFPVLRLLIWIGAVVFIIFAVFNPPMNTLVAISATAGLALGLGAQDLIKNVIAGILILFDRPFRVGDMIQVGEHYGEVTNIGLRSIRVQTFGDSTVTLPNALVLGQAVSNSNSGALDEMVEVHFTLPTQLDLGLVRGMAHESASSSPYVYLKKPIRVLIEDHFDRTFLTRLTIKAYVLDVRFERLLASDITQRFKSALQEHHLLPDTQLTQVIIE